VVDVKARSNETMALLKRIPQQRMSTAQESARAPEAPSRRGWAGRVWRHYVRMSVSADPSLSTVWIHGQCLDVSIYDRDWPESYRY
jgi:hypothetical protein